MENLYKPLTMFALALGENLTTKENLDAILGSIPQTRKHIFYEYGVKVPHVKVHDDKRLSPFEYSIEVNGVPVEKFTCMENSVMILDSERVTKKMRGKKTEEPAFKSPAQWIRSEREEEAKKNGYIIARYDKIIGVHLEEIIKRNLSSIITTQYVADLLDELAENNTALTDSIRYDLNNDTLIQGLGGRDRINMVKKVLQSLLYYKVSIRNIVQILEAICDTNDNKSLYKIVENVRKKIIGDIVGPHIVNNKLKLHMLSFSVSDYVKKPENFFDPDFCDALTNAVIEKYNACENDFFLIMPCTPSEDSRQFKDLYSLLHQFKNLHLIFFDELFAISEFFPSLKLENELIDFEIPKSIFDDEIKEFLSAKPSADYSEQTEKCDVLILNEDENIAVGLKYDVGKMNAPEVVVKSSEANLLKAACKNTKIVTDRPVLASQLFEHGTEGKAVTRDFFSALSEVFAEIRVESNFF